MDEIARKAAAFEASLKADGFAALTREVPAGQELDEHAHDWQVRGLVLQGAFHIAKGAEPATVFGPGESFALAPGEPHREGAGPDGARLLLGRKGG